MAKKKALKKDFFTFITAILITIFLSRILVWLIQERSLYLFGFEIHHFYLGVLLVMLAGFSRFFSKNKKLNKIDLIGFGIGNGLILDQFIFILFTNGNHTEYFSRFSILGSLGLIILVVVIYYFIFCKETKK